MKALTLTQPWATLVALGHKRVETRSWRTNHTGRIAIHAAKGFPPEAREFAQIERGLGRVPARLPLGAIVALATLQGCRFTQDVEMQLTGLERHLGNYSPGRYAWFLSDIAALPEPIPCRGALSLWTLPVEVLNALHPGGQQYVRQPDGHDMLCNADGTRSIFDDVDQ